jgi:flagellar motor switch protein FliG
MKRNPKLLNNFAEKLRKLVKIQQSGKTRLREVLNEALQVQTENDFCEYIVLRNIDTFFEAYDKVLGEEKVNPDQLTFL